MNFKNILDKKQIRVSVPCRIDLGGTLDLSTFFLPLNYLRPSTFNIALDMRTTVTLLPWRDNYIKISSKGFDSAEFEASKAPFNHPMGLMFASAAFFNAHGVHVQIESSSPPRSALGGSSAAAVAIIASFFWALGQEIHYNADDVEDHGEPLQGGLSSLSPTPTITPGQIALIAHIIESSVAGVPCGLQDQLAAAYGGVNQWLWCLDENGGAGFKRHRLVKAGDDLKSMNQNILVAYCGIPHVSSNVNKRWVNQFLAGENREKWKQICGITEDFSRAVMAGDYEMAAVFMNKETGLRLEMTPDVLDGVGHKLFRSAKEKGCGARFTGAGGGGCVWAVGRAPKISDLRDVWQDIIDGEPGAELLNTCIDAEGIC